MKTENNEKRKKKRAPRSTMGYHRVSVYEVRKWLGSLKELKIMQFQHSELPEEVKGRSLIRKANVEGFIRSVKKVDGDHVWEICEDNNRKFR